MTRWRHFESDSLGRPSIGLAQISLGLAFVSGFGAFSGIFSIPVGVYFALQTLLVAAALLTGSRGPLPRLRVPVPTVLFVAWWCFSYFWSSAPWAFRGVSVQDLASLVVVVLFIQLLSQRRFFRTLIWAGYCSMVMIAVALVIQPRKAYPDTGPLVGLVGGFVHKNYMASAMILTTVTVLCFESRVAVRRLVVVLSIIIVVLGKTTTGLASFMLAFVVLAFLVRMTRVTQYLGRASSMILLAAGVVLTATFAQLSRGLVGLVGKDTTFSSRTLIWDSVVERVKHRPLTGYGYGAFVNAYVDPAATINRSIGFGVTSAHNGPLELLLRLGIVGLGLYLLQFALTVRRGWRLQKRDEPAGRVILLFCVIVCTFAFSESFVMLGIWFALLSALSLDPLASAPTSSAQQSG